MAFTNTKVNIPMDTSNPLPNVNNLTAEASYITQLVNKTNRNNSGQFSFSSTTSGKTYRTIDYPSDPNIYNRGETGLYNLLVKLYGGKDGWIMMAEDYNLINTEFANIQTQFTGQQASITANTTNIATNTTNIATNTANIATNTASINGIKDGTVKVPYIGISGKPTNFPTDTNTVAHNSGVYGNTTVSDALQTINSTVKIKGDFYTLTGLFTPTAKNIDYPSGLNQGNCVVLSAMGYSSLEGAETRLTYGATFAANSYLMGGNPMFVSFTPTVIQIQAVTITLSNDFVIKADLPPDKFSYKIVLMKL